MINDFLNEIHLLMATNIDNFVNKALEYFLEFDIKP